MTIATVAAAAKLDNWVREPTDSMAAVREALGPEINEPVNAEAMLVIP
jgi:hypothetical protein